MDTNHRMAVWSATWTILGDTVVCTGCMRGQELSDSEASFEHDPACKAGLEASLQPWVSLHNILDVQRG